MFTQLKTRIRCEILRWKVQRLDKRTRELRQELAEMHNDFNEYSLYCDFETGRQERLRQNQSKNRQDMTVSNIGSIKLNQESVGGNHHE